MDDELYLEISDDYKDIEYFDIDSPYEEYHSGKRFNQVRVSVKREGKTIAYLECILFFDEKINEAGADLVSVADDELNDDSYEAMQILEEQGLLNRDEESNLYYLLATNPVSTVYLQHIAVREDFGGKGIGEWLVRNLPSIIEINCKVCLGVIIVKLYPERVDWSYNTPMFSPDLGEPEEDAGMFLVMKKLFEANGYVRHKKSLFFIRDFAWNEVE